MTFKLHPNLLNKPFIMDLPLSTVLLEDNAHYPWIFLVPRRENVRQIMGLDFNDQVQLLREMDKAQQVLQELFQPAQLNVAAIGNKTPQLHVHVIARFETDPAWPGTVWDHAANKSYTDLEKSKLIRQIYTAFVAS